MRADFGKKDRPLTAACAELGSLEVRTGKGKGKAKGSGAGKGKGTRQLTNGPTKRESPDPDRGERSARRREK